MAIEMFKCECGQEFEDSEFRISPECEDCRNNWMARAIPPEPPPQYNSLQGHIDLMNRAYQAQAQAMSWQAYDPLQNLGGSNTTSHYRQNADGTFTLTYSTTQG